MDHINCLHAGYQASAHTHAHMCTAPTRICVQHTHAHVYSTHANVCNPSLDTSSLQSNYHELSPQQLKAFEDGVKATRLTRTNLKKQRTANLKPLKDRLK